MNKTKAAVAAVFVLGALAAFRFWRAASCSTASAPQKPVQRVAAPSPAGDAAPATGPQRDSRVSSKRTGAEPASTPEPVGAAVPEGGQGSAPAVAPAPALPSPQSRSALPVADGSAASAGRAGSAPVVMTDYRSWTVIGADAEPVSGEDTFFSGGIGIANSNGLWITAQEGFVSRTNDRISAISVAGEARIRAREAALQAVNLEVRDSPDGQVTLTAETVTFSRAAVATNSQPESGSAGN